MGLRDYTIYDVIRRNADLYPQAECLVFNDTRLTHKTFREKCDRLAAGLIRSGIGTGDRIGVVAHNCDEFVILYGAAAKIGAIVLPVNWRFQKEEVRFVLNDCTPRCLFVGPDYRRTVAEMQDALGFVENFYTIGGGDVPAGFEPLESLYTDQGASDEIDLPADVGFVIIHTAAVQGRPRGALLSQKNIFSMNLQLMHSEALGPDSCHICILPLFHIAGLARLTGTLHAGGKNVILERFDPVLTLKMIETEKGTTFFNFAPILKRLIDAYDDAGGSFDLSTVRHVGGLDHPENIHRFMEIAPQARFGAGFGQTEAMGVTWAPVEERPGSAGKPTRISRVALFDDADREVPVGTPGEICVRGPAVFMGYWGREADTQYTFRNGWHHTGDIGRFDSDGYLWYVKRKAEKELIKPGGENVYPAEVEQVILEHPAVDEVSVIGVADRQWGEAIKAVVVLKEAQTATAEELTEFVAAKIARYKKPKVVTFVEALPKTEDGAIDRDQVKKDHGGKY